MRLSGSFSQACAAEHGQGGTACFLHLRAQAQEERIKREERADGRRSRQRTVNGEEAHEFTPGRKACADYAAQQRQRAADD